MDPFSVTVGVAGLGTAAVGAYKISKKIRRMNRDIKVAGLEIESLAEEVNTYGLLIETACLAIDPYLKSNRASSAVFCFLHTTKVLDKLAIQSKSIIKQRSKINFPVFNLSEAGRDLWLVLSGFVKRMMS